MQNNGPDLDKKLLREMFNKIRADEISNVKTQKYEDKKMVVDIFQYITSKIEELEKHED